MTVVQVLWHGPARPEIKVTSVGRSLSAPPHDLDQKTQVDRGEQYGRVRKGERHALFGCCCVFCGYFAVRQL